MRRRQGDKLKKGLTRELIFFLCLETAFLGFFSRINSQNISSSKRHRQRKKKTTKEGRKEGKRRKKGKGKERRKEGRKKKVNKKKRQGDKETN